MNKSLLAGLGIAGACAACCAFPLALPLLTGVSGAALAGMLGLQQLPASAAAGLAVAVGLAGGGLALWFARRRQRRAPHCTVPQDPPRAGGCGCTGGGACA